ncbi:competence protein ComK [Cytobacillus depressus]
MRSQYTINKDFKYMKGYRDRHGKLCTLVKETEKTFMVDKSPLEIIDDSIVRIGYNLKGAMETSKRLLGNIYHHPVLVCPIQRIVLFPTQSAKHEECIWFNPNHIKRTTSHKRQTFITFSNGKTKIIRAKLCSFNSKLQIAEQLENMTRENRVS